MYKPLKKILFFGLVTVLTTLPFAVSSPAADLTKVSTLPIQVKKTSVVPVGTVIAWPVAGNPEDWQNSDGTYNWLECNGQTISASVYPELHARIGSKVPDYRGEFLRGLQPGYVVGQHVEDTFESHLHGQPAHTHSWNGRLVSTALTGTAAGQKYYDAKAGYHTKTAIQSNKGHVFGSSDFIKHVGGQRGEYFPIVTAFPGENFIRIEPITTNTAGAHGGHGDSGSLSGSHSHTINTHYGSAIQNAVKYWIVDGYEDYAKASSVTGHLSNGTVIGTVGSSGGDDTYETGDAETAPKHTYVRYFIRARFHSY